MTGVPEVVVHHDADALAAAVAARLVTRLAEVAGDADVAHVALTGGRIGTASLAAVLATPAHDAVDWARVQVWWSDERFLPSGDPERNETGAREALLDHVPLRPEAIHAMPATGGTWGDDVDLAAAAYAAELAAAARPEDHGPVPQFDVALLGVGPDGHVASLFPELPALHDDRPVCGVRGAPKPPPTRITFTLPTINRSREVWLIASGEEKAAAVRLALTGAGPVQVPAAGVRGTARTLVLLDEAAASRLPRSLHPHL